MKKQVIIPVAQATTHYRENYDLFTFLKSKLTITSSCQKAIITNQDQNFNSQQSQNNVKYIPRKTLKLVCLCFVFRSTTRL